ncbi:MAG: SpoIIE family protein phosphatase [Vicinamibacterales bacterium]
MAANPENAAAHGPAGRLAALRRRYPGWPPVAIVAGGGIKLVLFALRQAGLPAASLLDLLDTFGSLLLLAGLVPLVVRGVGQARRRLKWWVRGKLFLSYVFIGVFPVLLVIAFFLLSGLLLLLSVSSYLVASSLRALTEEARFIAQTTVVEIQKGGGPSAAQVVIDRKQATLEARYRGASIALVPTPPEPCAGRGAVEAPTRQGVPSSSGDPSGQPGGAAPGARRPAFPAIVTGAWAHVRPPDELPVWVACSGFGGLIPYLTSASPVETRLVIRGAALPDEEKPGYAAVVDIPLNEDVVERLREETSIKLGDVTLIPDQGEDRGGRAGGTPSAVVAQAGERAGRGSTSGEQDEVTGETPAGAAKFRFPWVTFLEWIDWRDGRTHRSAMSILVNLADIYDRLSEYQAPVDPTGLSLVRLILWLLAFVAGLFLIIEGVALVMGLALGRSITSAVHELFTGTELVRRGDFSHRIRVRTDDQLGQLAASFNSMTSSIEDLLQQAAEKKRMEEELRIAREIQMSLLPRGPLKVPGLSMTALCVPAREVGGDYYDFVRLDDKKLALLIADVAGKGTSAALYMSELKGIVLSLAKSCSSPRDLLIRANRIISENLDTRSFITMTYAVIDLDAARMTYARAGHTPLIYRYGTHPSGDGAVRVLAPDGMVLGLQFDDGSMFERLLEEATLPLRSGDVLMFFTDGISEAMNEESDCFGEARLGRIVADYGDLPPDRLRERVLREIEVFVGGAPQHDDMTLIIVKIESLAAAVAGEGGAAMAVRS